MTDPASDVDEATPIEAVKWCFVRRRLAGLFLAHGYREVMPPPLELRGTNVLAHGKPAWTVGEDLELRADPLVSLAQLYARSRREAGLAPGSLQRWLLCDVVFDAEAAGPHRYPAWPTVCGALFGVSTLGAELEVLSLAQRIAADLGLRQSSLRVGLPATPRGDALRVALEELAVRFVEEPALLREDGDLGFELCAAPGEDEARIAVMRGGRRNGLLGALGETAAPLIGLALSVRRAASCMPGIAETYDPAAEVFFCVVGEPARTGALAAAGRERARGLRVEVELRELPLEVQLARALALRARVVVIFRGPTEDLLIRQRDDPAERTVPLAELSGALRRLLR